jgi:serine protease Do
LDYGEGVFIAGLEEGSPAEKAGLHLGDIIVGGENYPIQNMNRFHGVMANWPQGETILIQVRRWEKKEWKKHSVRVLLGVPN